MADVATMIDHTRFMLQCYHMEDCLKQVMKSKELFPSLNLILKLLILEVIVLDEDRNTF